MLATLFKDERCQQLPAYSILEKMYLDRIIRRSELHEFEALMQSHQKVCMTVLPNWQESMLMTECPKNIGMGFVKVVGWWSEAQITQYLT